jgi:hypothetical protein
MEDSQNRLIFAQPAAIFSLAAWRDPADGARRALA